VKVAARKPLTSAKRRLLKKIKTCAICGDPVTAGQASVDHRIPLSRGGSNRADNLQLAHKRCNFDKGSTI
jgi:5-methylcytosine-specific restriction endonuclease McrA